MTKRLTIALVALAVVLLFAALPVSARVTPAVQNITNAGATVFIGEQGLNLTGAENELNGANPAGFTQIGWWASAAVITTTPPTKAISLTGRDTNFLVTPSDFVGYTGNWYLYDGNPADPDKSVN